MSDTSNPKEAQPAGASPTVVPLGSRMPGPPGKTPVLATGQRDAAPGGEANQPRTEIASGVSFVGSALLNGVCTVKGKVQGNLKQAAGAKIAVIVTESGHVKGDILADQISVMGHTEGLLDATGGSVVLHDTASVAGRVRYMRIQVNGCDLNATLERSPPKSPQSAEPAQAPAKAAGPAVDPLPGLQFPPGSVPGVKS